MREIDVRRIGGYKPFWLEDKYIIRCKKCRHVNALSNKVVRPTKSWGCGNCGTWGSCELIKIKKILKGRC